MWTQRCTEIWSLLVIFYFLSGVMSSCEYIIFFISFCLPLSVNKLNRPQKLWIISLVAMMMYLTSEAGNWCLIKTHLFLVLDSPYLGYCSVLSLGLNNALRDTFEERHSRCTKFRVHSDIAVIETSPMITHWRKLIIFGLMKKWLGGNVVAVFGHLRSCQAEGGVDFFSPEGESQGHRWNLFSSQWKEALFHS